MTKYKHYYYFLKTICVYHKIDLLQMDRGFRINRHRKTCHKMARSFGLFSSWRASLQI